MADQTKLITSVRESAASRPYADSLGKRLYDIFLASLLLFTSAPILLLSIAVNTLVTGGHPLFVQRRAGKNKVEFGLIKLRTMRMPKEGENWSHRTDIRDERLTFFGKVLRRSYVDELPQLVNILVGHMSMVGPRPETLETTIKISDSNPRFVERTGVKPGLTGVAQIFFRKPESEHDLWRRYYYDHVYILHASLRYDLELTARTVLHVLHNKGH